MRLNRRVWIAAWVLAAFTAFGTAPAGSAPAPDPGTAYVYPQPALRRSPARIVFAMREAGRAEARIYREDGSLALRLNEPVPAGVTSLAFDPSRLSPGVYLMRVTLRYAAGGDERLRSFWFVVSP